MSLAPLPGDAETVLVKAARLRVMAERVGAVQSVLLGLHAGSRWDSPAGARFAAKTVRLSPVLDSMASRYAGASAALRTFAAALQEAQDVTTREIQVNEGALGDRDRWLQDMEALPVTDQEGRATLRAKFVEAAGEAQASRGRYLAAQQRFEEADRQCCGSLDALADDALKDSGTYHALTAAADLSGEVSRQLGPLAVLPLPQTKAAGVVVAAAGAVQVSADALLLAHYGDGDGGELAKKTTLAALGFGAGALKLGAKAGGVARGELTPVQELTMAQRLAVGAKRQVIENHPFRRRSSPSAVTVAKLLTDGRLPIRTRAVKAAMAKADQVWLDDLAIANRNGDQATAMLLASWSAAMAKKTYLKGTQVKEKHAAEDGEVSRLS